MTLPTARIIMLAEPNFERRLDELSRPTTLYKATFIAKDITREYINHNRVYRCNKDGRH